MTIKKNITTATYLQVFLSTLYEELRRISEASGSTRGALTCADIRHFRIAIPPAREQGQILHYIGTSVRKQTLGIEVATREIELLREYRIRLIADVVTGKLDVREAAAKLPEVTPAVGSLDEIGDLSQDEESAETGELEAEEAA